MPWKEASVIFLRKEFVDLAGNWFRVYVKREFVLMQPMSARSVNRKAV